MRLMKPSGTLLGIEADAGTGHIKVRTACCTEGSSRTRSPCRPSVVLEDAFDSFDILTDDEVRQGLPGAVRAKTRI